MDMKLDTPNVVVAGRTEKIGDRTWKSLGAIPTRLRKRKNLDHGHSTRPRERKEWVPEPLDHFAPDEIEARLKSYMPSLYQ